MNPVATWTPLATDIKALEAFHLKCQETAAADQLATVYQK